MRTHPQWRNPLVVGRTEKRALYLIRVRGVLSETLLGAFPELEAETEDGATVLTGTIPDQPALYGVLAEIEALGLELLEVRALPS